VVQYDKQLPIVAVELYLSGNLYTLPATMDVKIRFGEKKDKTFIYKNVLGCNEARTIVYFDVDEQMSYFSGSYNPTLELSVIGTNPLEKAGSSAIPIVIDRNPVQETDIVSMNEYSDLIQAVADAQAAQALAEQAVLDAKDEVALAEAQVDLAEAQAALAEAAKLAAQAAQTAAEGYRDELAEKILDVDKIDERLDDNEAALALKVDKVTEMFPYNRKTKNDITAGMINEIITGAKSPISSIKGNSIKLDNIYGKGLSVKGRLEGKGKVAYVNKTIDEPIAELNNKTLREVFEGGNMIKNYDFHHNSGTTVSKTYNTNFQVLPNAGGTTVNMYNGGVVATLGKEYYIRLTSKYGMDRLRVYYGAYTTTPVLGNNYSIKLTATLTVSLHLELRSTTIDGEIGVHELYSINLTDLGISSLTDMDYYYSLYQARKNITKKVLTYADIFETFQIVDDPYFQDITVWSTQYASEVQLAEGIKVTNDGSQAYSNYFRGLAQDIRYVNTEKYFLSAVIKKLNYFTEGISIFLGNSENTYITPSDYASHPVDITRSKIFVYDNAYPYLLIRNHGQYADNAYIAKRMFVVPIKHFDESITQEQLDTLLNYYLQHKANSLYDVENFELETVGKNLYDYTKDNIGYYLSDGNLAAAAHVNTSDYIKVKPSTAYIMSKAGVLLGLTKWYYDENKIAISVNYNGAFTTPINAHYLRFDFARADHDNTTIQIELGSVVTTYTQHTNAITKFTNVPLAAVPSVQDELIQVNTRWFKIQRTANGLLSANLINNSTFDTDTGWSKGTGWVISGGVASVNADAGVNLTQSPMLIGKLYKITFSAIITSGSIRVYGGAGGAQLLVSERGEYTLYTTALVNGTLYFQTNEAGTVGSIDNVYVYEITTVIGAPINYTLGNQNDLIEDGLNGYYQLATPIITEVFPVTEGIVKSPIIHFFQKQELPTTIKLPHVIETSDEIATVSKTDIKEVNADSIYQDWNNSIFIDLAQLVKEGQISAATEVAYETWLEANSSYKVGQHFDSIDQSSKLNKIISVTENLLPKEPDIPQDINTPVAELNGKTLKEVFEDGNLEYNSKFELANSQWRAYNAAYGYENQMLNVFNSNYTNRYVLYSNSGAQSFDPIKGHKYFYTFRLSANIEIDYVTLKNQLEGSDLIYHSNNILPGIWKRFSSIFIDNDLFTWFYVDINVWTARTIINPTDKVFMDDVYIYDLTNLNIDHLSQQQMDYWYSVYDYLKNGTPITVFKQQLPMIPSVTLNLGYKGIPTELRIEYLDDDYNIISSEVKTAFLGTTYKYGAFTVPANTKFVNTYIKPSEPVNDVFISQLQSFLKFAVVDGTAINPTLNNIYTVHGTDVVQLPDTTLRKGVKGFVELMTINKSVNGDFTNSYVGWTPSVVGTPIMFANIASFLPTALYSSFNQVQLLNIGDVYIIRALLKSDSNLIDINAYKDGPTYDSWIGVAYTNVGKWQILSGIGTATQSNNRIRVLEKKSSGWTRIYLKYFQIINLSELYRKGIIPYIPTTAAEFEQMIIEDELDLVNLNLIKRIGEDGAILAEPVVTPIPAQNDDYTANNYGMELYEHETPVVNDITSSYYRDTAAQVDTNASLMEDILARLAALEAL